MKKLRKSVLIRNIIDTIGADCSLSLSKYKHFELEEYWNIVQKDYPTIKFEIGYKGKHKVTYCYWADTERRSYETKDFQIEVLLPNDFSKRLAEVKENFKENTILFKAYQYPEWMNKKSDEFEGIHIFKHNPEQDSPGVWYGGTGHKVFANKT